MLVCLFEDESFEAFLPLTYTKPIFELKCGMFSFRQRIERVFQDYPLILSIRDYLTPSFKQKVSNPVNDPNAIDDDLLLVNGSLIVGKQTAELAQKRLGKNTALMQDNKVVLAHLSEETAKKHAETLCKFITQRQLRKVVKQCETLEAQNLSLILHPWNLVSKCKELISEDFKLLEKKGSEGVMDKRVVVYGDRSNLYLGDESFVESFAVLDVRNGPIYVGRRTMIHSGSRICGPAYIGSEVIVAMGLIREGCHVGDVCRVGGELDATILHGYTNKYHTGYIGHSYVGEWVNIGAATTNSNLKNTYGTVKVTIKGKKVDTHLVKVGCFIGDHVKTSIGTQIYTGKKIGVASHVHGFVTDDVPSFTLWAKSLGAEPKELYLESVIETQRRVFARRGIKQTREDIELLEKLFRLTAQERKKAGVIKGKFEL
jgi:UDP-N-acetylglucosamine diphosphorylase/glucosamine-1-phosphate N-acetyltransferase